jgi:hypothetical protein
MRQSLRLYKQHDTDLIALQVMGVSISKLAKRVVESYANGVRVKMALPECGPVDISDLQIARSDFITKDKKTICLLQSIKKGKRPQFIKTLIRSSLLTQSLSVFFTDERDIESEKNYISSLDIDINELMEAPRINKHVRFDDILLKEEKTEEIKEEKKEPKKEITEKSAKIIEPQMRENRPRESRDIKTFRHKYHRCSGKASQ